MKYVLEAQGLRGPMLPPVKLLAHALPRVGEMLVVELPDQRMYFQVKQVVNYAFFADDVADVEGVILPVVQAKRLPGV